ncbi:hypothetical protein TNCV_156341 [Trichonephila clavipes]|nr:hypothetical protein TNCV_156341 [Trichonephila clavipes]
MKPNLTDVASLDKLISFVFGEEPATPAHTHEPQLLHMVPSIFDRNNDLISFLVERELGTERLDLRMPRVNHCVKKSHSKATCLIWPFMHMPTCFTMVANLFPSNCRLHAFQRMVKIQK